MVGSYTFSADRNLPGIDIITRAQRGADESRRYDSQKVFQNIQQVRDAQAKELQLLKETDFDAYMKKKAENYKSESINEYLDKKYSDEQSIDRKITTYNDYLLRWTEYFKTNKTKLIIHHTAEDSTALLTGGLDATKKKIREIYKYHTLSNARGDIGYNFLIDPAGNIFE